jgi:hypothetical protein
MTQNKRVQPGSGGHQEEGKELGRIKRERLWGGTRKQWWWW